jgi:enoyl reductase-like protein
MEIPAVGLRVINCKVKKYRTGARALTETVALSNTRPKRPWFNDSGEMSVTYESQRLRHIEKVLGHKRKPWLSAAQAGKSHGLEFPTVWQRITNRKNKVYHTGTRELTKTQLLEAKDIISQLFGVMP